MILKMTEVCQTRGLRLIIENPFSSTHYLHNNFLKEPSYIDKDRTRRGDFFKKPTGFWFFNCEPEKGFTHQQSKVRTTILSSNAGVAAGICSEERSMISPDYARNWICDLVLGIQQPDVDTEYGEALF